jgi:hypothetical protein
MIFYYFYDYFFFLNLLSMDEIVKIGPFTEKQLNLLGIVPKQVCYFSSLDKFCLGCRTIRQRAARWLIVLHPM